MKTSKCECGAEFTREEYWWHVILFCPNCCKYEVFEKECEHEFRAALFTIAGGNTQVREVCANCYYMHPQPRSRNEYKNLITKDLAAYKLFIAEKTRDYYTRLEELRTGKQINFAKQYEEYIQSEQWKAKRELVLTRDSGTCQICFNSGNHVHHLTYKHFKAEFLFELVTLCETCHLQYYHETVH